MADIIGTNGNDTLAGSDSANTIKGLAGNDSITANGNDTLTGGGGKDEFVFYSFYDDPDIITDFGGVGKGTNPTAAVIAEVDILKFQGSAFTAQNLLLTQNGSNLEITFEQDFNKTKVILQNFALENLDNLSKSTGATVDLGNIEFDGQTSISDSFDVFNANSTQNAIFNKNTVTFLNDLNNNVSGFDNSDDVINGQGGDDIIDGKSGNDLLRGGIGNDTLIGGAGDDTLNDDTGNNSLVGGIGDDNLNVEFSTGNNTLNGGTGNDTLSAGATSGNNLLFGGDGNDSLDASYRSISSGYDYIASNGNNTFNGGAGDDTLSADSPFGNNLLSGGDGNDYLSKSGYDHYRAYFSFSSSGDNTLKGGAGDDTLRAEYSTGNNLLSGGDGNDSLSTSGYLIPYYQSLYDSSSGNNTLNGGTGDDTLRAEYSTGNNLLSGGDGNDSFYLSPTDTAPSDLVTQTVDGGKGDDLLSVDYSLATKGIITTFNGTTNIGSITAGTYQVSYKNIEQLNITGTDYDDLIVGSDGNDTLSTGSGNLTFAGNGDVLFTGGGGKDTIDGGNGDDFLYVNYINNATVGITSTFNASTNIGSITAGTNGVSYKNIERLNISGTNYDDYIIGSNGNDTLSTGDANLILAYGDLLSTGGGGKDTIDGGNGDDLLPVNYSDATAGITSTFNTSTNIGSITAGTNGVSYKNIERLNISGTNYDDYIVGTNGNDTLSTHYNYYHGGNDTIDGGKGDDLLSFYYYSYNGDSEGITSTFNASTNIGSITVGTNGVSYKNIERLNIIGTDYDDLIVGTNGNDTLSGYGENDTIIGGAGNDILTGGYGNDSLYAGAGTDTFVFNSFNEGIDQLYDFNATNELIQVSATGFDGGLSIGSLSASQFIQGTSAITIAQRFIYDNVTGGLFFDQDGSASGFTQVKFAQLSPGVALTEKNFLVV
ncbi:MAG: calcium-binding protein [Nostoc sp.]|uniref:beta strand repeat-containing protein n=1 Tax=Nostoc sp. TaxID=1180 RepID=UPI002FFB9A8D